jgi:hypothetical protein
LIVALGAAAQVKATHKWLLSQQRPDGSWASGLGSANIPATVVTTSFVGLSLMASGGPHDAEVSRAARYVIDNMFENKLPFKIDIPANLDQSNWKLAIGRLFLCEHYARQQARNPKAKNAQMDALLQRIVDDACKRMEPSGGWGHTPTLKNPLGYVELEVMSNWMLAMMGASQVRGPQRPQGRSAQRPKEGPLVPGSADHGRAAVADCGGALADRRRSLPRF